MIQIQKALTWKKETQIQPHEFKLKYIYINNGSNSRKTKEKKVYSY